jgi:hypothetical protein
MQSEVVEGSTAAPLSFQDSCAASRAPSARMVLPATVFDRGEGFEIILETAHTWRLRRAPRSVRDSHGGDPAMTQKSANPFDSIESAYEYVSLIREAVDEAYSAVQDDTEAAQRTKGAERRVEALLLVDCKLNQLRQHLLASLIILNDLRTLRRLLLGERE